VTPEPNRFDLGCVVESVKPADGTAQARARNRIGASPPGCSAPETISNTKQLEAAGYFAEFGGQCVLFDVDHRSVHWVPRFRENALTRSCSVNLSYDEIRYGYYSWATAQDAIKPTDLRIAERLGILWATDPTAAMYQVSRIQQEKKPSPPRLSIAEMRASG
jgi:hypothetical protein